MPFTLPPVALLYPHRVDIWRRDEENQADGERDTSTVPTRRATNAACYFQTGESVKGPQGFIVDESDNLFTLDIVRFPDTADLEAGDVLVQTTGPDAGHFWEVRGDPQKRAQFGQFLTVRASRTPAVHPTIAEAY